jgi:hypothetical protein
MPNSQVPRVELNPDGSISIQVSVYGFDGGTPVELSGQATQANGAVATFYQVQATPPHDGETVDLWVSSVAPVAPNKFDAGFSITVVVRATEAWITTLDQDATSSGFISRKEGSAGSALSGAWTSNSYGWAVAPSPAQPRGSAPAPVATPPAVTPSALQ